MRRVEAALPRALPDFAAWATVAVAAGGAATNECGAR